MNEKLNNTSMSAPPTLKESLFIQWIKLLNLELEAYDECMSCFTSDNSLLERWFEGNLNPLAAATELHFMKSAKRDKCLCSLKEYK